MRFQQKKFTGSFVRVYTDSIAAKASLPANRPMIIASTVVYKDCSIMPSNIGIANITTFFQTTPSVKSYFLAINSKKAPYLIIDITVKAYSNVSFK